MSSNSVTPTESDALNDSATNLHKSYAKLNEALTKLFDENGVRRSFTVPYVSGEPTADHITSVGKAAAQTGGLTKSLLTTAHHSAGKGWGSGDGQTVGHPAHDLRKTVIMPNSENAKATLAAAQKLISGIATLLGDDDPTVKVAQGQLNLVKKSDGAGMNLLDFGSILVQIVAAPLQAVARAHQGAKPNGHSPLLTAPRGGVAPQPQAQPDENPNA